MARTIKDNAEIVVSKQTRGTTLRKPRKTYDAINPKHYEIKLRTVNGQTVKVEVVDIIEAICPQDAHMAHVMTYILRAGRKAKSSYVEDLKKARWWITRSLKFHGAEK